MKMMAIGEWVRAHVRESTIYLVMGVLCLYILFVMQTALWMKLIVVALILFGTYEVIAQMQGKPSPSQGLKKAIAEAQKGMDMGKMGDMGPAPEFADLTQEFEGFGPFRQPKRRKR